MVADLPRRPGMAQRLYPDGHHMLLHNLASAQVITDIAAWVGSAAPPPLSTQAAAEFCAGVRGRLRNDR